MKKLLTSLLIATSFNAFSETAPEFIHTLDQGYWYSRYNLGELTMKSGNGEIFMPEMAQVDMMLKMTSDSLSQAMAPKNPALLKRVFNTGNPQFSSPDIGDMMDFQANRWETSANQAPLTTYQAFAWTVTKEVEWSKQFNVDAHFGTPGGIAVPGAQERFNGVVLCAEALMQSMEFMMNPTVFAAPTTEGLASALIAISDLSHYLKTKSTHEMSMNRCAQAASMMMKKTPEVISAEFLMFADGLYEKLAKENLSTLKDKALTIQALSWYGLANDQKREEVRTLIKNIARDLTKLKAKDALEQAYLVRAFNDAARITGNAAYTRSFEQALAALVSDHDTKTGIFKSKKTYSTDDVAVILAGLNAGKLFATKGDAATPVFISFFDTILNKAPMQISAPAVEGISAYERKPDSRLHRSSLLPLPRKTTNGKFGTAPVFAASVTFDGKSFKVQDDLFDTAGAMHLANEMIWFHNAEVDGFPKF